MIYIEQRLNKDTQRIKKMLLATPQDCQENYSVLHPYAIWSGKLPFVLEGCVDRQTLQEKEKKSN